MKKHIVSRKQLEFKPDHKGGTIVYHEGNLFTGWYEKFHENGQKNEEGCYIEGRVDGPENWWYEDGQKWLERNSKKGKLHGWEIRWHRDGQKWLEKNHYENELHGLYHPMVQKRAEKMGYVLYGR